MSTKSPISSKNVHPVDIKIRRSWRPSEVERIFKDVTVETTFRIPSHVDKKTFQNQLRKCIDEINGDDEMQTRKKQKTDVSKQTVVSPYFQKEELRSSPTVNLGKRVETSKASTMKIAESELSPVSAKSRRVDVSSPKQPSNGLSSAEQLPQSKRDKLEVTYNAWKARIPILYDFVTNHSLGSAVSVACEWGNLPSSPQPGRDVFQRFYYSTTEGNQHKIMVTKVALPPFWMSDILDLAQYDEDEPSSFILESQVLSPAKPATIIRTSTQNEHLFATHTNNNEVYIWNLEKQTHNAIHAPNLCLEGHKDKTLTTKALDWSPKAEKVISGGEDKMVLLWNIEDYEATGIRQRVKARGQFIGHEGSVVDVTFNPSDDNLFFSVGRDNKSMLWDARSGSKSVAVVPAGGELTSVSWNRCDPNLLLFGVNKTVKLHDRRKLSSPISSFACSGKVTKVLWSPHDASNFAAVYENEIAIWDSIEERVLFIHGGHRFDIMDVAWNPSVQWTFASTALDYLSGSTLQIWRPNDFIFRDEAEQKRDMKRHVKKVPQPEVELSD